MGRQSRKLVSLQKEMLCPMVLIVCVTDIIQDSTGLYPWLKRANCNKTETLFAWAVTNRNVGSQSQPPVRQHDFVSWRRTSTGCSSISQPSIVYEMLRKFRIFAQQFFVAQLPTTHYVRISSKLFPRFASTLFCTADKELQLDAFLISIWKGLQVLCRYVYLHA